MQGLRAILSQTHGHEGGAESEPDQWTPAAMAQRMQSSQSGYRIVVGSHDRMAPPEQALQLARILARENDADDNAEETFDGDNQSMFKVMEGCGHAVPMEEMRLWRQDVLEFLNKP